MGKYRPLVCFLFFATVVVAVALIIFLILFVLIISRIYVTNPITRVKHHLRYTEINLDRNKSDDGIAILDRALLEDEYITYSNEKTGDFIVLSNIDGEEEYECTGSCFCDTATHNNRKYASIVSRGLYMAITAFSALTAMNIANEVFRDDCAKKYSDICDSENIISEVTDCTGTEAYEEPKDESRRYSCTGHCLSNKRLKAKDAVEKVGTVGCENMEISKEITLNCRKAGIGQHCNGQAKDKFRFEVVTPFCKQQSQIEYLYEGKESLVLKKSNACVSQNSGGLKKNIVCILQKKKGSDSFIINEELMFQ